MLPSKMPFLFLAQVIGICAAVIVCIAVTGNPLALMALFFVPSFPVVGGSESGQFEGNDSPEMGEPSEYSESSMGFMSHLKK